VAGALTTTSGLGHSARLCYEAFRACGVEAYGIDLTAALGQPADRTDFTFADGRALRGAGTLIIHVNSPLLPLALLALGRGVVEGKWVTGYWHWELPQAPEEWRPGASYVHEVWTPSRFTASAVAHVAGPLQLRVLPQPVALGFQRATTKAIGASGGLRGLISFDMASSFARKNPLAAIAAFEKAFGQSREVRLVVKVTHSDTYPEGARALRQAVDALPNATLIDRTIGYAEIQELYAQTDVVISLHRSEGFGLVVAEAMLSGRPAVSTDWSSTAEFLTPETGVPVNYRLVSAVDLQGEYNYPAQSWAEADIEDAAEKLSALADPARRRAIGEAAQTDAYRRFSAQNYVERAFDSLGQPAPNR
jgi:glycosyltransferase involved in cell wall biosynthesis